GGDEFGQEREHLLGQHAHRLRAVDVEREIIGPEVGLELGKFRERGDVTVLPRLGGTREGVVDQLTDEPERAMAGPERSRGRRRLRFGCDCRHRLASLFLRWWSWTCDRGRGTRWPRRKCRAGTRPG